MTDELCWCGDLATVDTDGLGDRPRGWWCYEHAPRCRSGAHWFNNCYCVGEQELRRIQARLSIVCSCGAEFPTLDTLKVHAEAHGGLQHGDGPDYGTGDGETLW